MVDQVEGCASDPGRKLLDLHAVEVVNPNLAEQVETYRQLSRAPLLLGQTTEACCLQATDLSISNDEEVPASTRRIEERQVSDLVVENLQLWARGRRC